MRALTILKYGKYPTLTTGELPKSNDPKLHLVRMKYAPINPSDLMFYIGTYAIKKELPVAMGFEGSGVVLDSQDKELIGKVVSVRSTETNGTYSTHLLVPKSSLIVWPEGTQPKDIACSITNPMTAIGLRITAQKLGYSNVLLSAANSSLNRMMIRYLKKFNIKVYGLVRNPDQAADLEKLGAFKVWAGLDDEKTLGQIKKIEEKICFMDCVGGDVAGGIFNHLPDNSTMINYGRLSKQRLGNIDIGEIYYKNKKIEGFWLVNFMKTLTKEQAIEAQKELIQDFKEFFTTDVGKIYKLEDYMEAFGQSIKPGAGKIVLDLQ